MAVVVDPIQSVKGKVYNVLDLATYTSLPQLYVQMGDYYQLKIGFLSYWSYRSELTSNELGIKYQPVSILSSGCH